METIIEIDNLTEVQKLALEDMLATWVALGNQGSSRWTSYFADGDGDFHPNITIDGKKPHTFDALPRSEVWFDNSYKIDYDWVAKRMNELGDITEEESKAYETLKQTIELSATAYHELHPDWDWKKCIERAEERALDCIRQWKEY